VALIETQEGEIRLDIVSKVLAHVENTLEEMVAENIRICEIPAPSYQEKERAEYIARRFREEGLKDVRVDEVYNVYGRIAGAGGKTAMLAGHSDTVFPLGTDVTVRREGDILRAPGVRDNSTGVAALVTFARVVRELDLTPPGDVILVATSCEEGLGDLRGMKAAMAELKDEVDYVIGVDGSLGGLVHEGICSRRLKVTATTGGGHSWGNFGVPSAIHALGSMIHGISGIKLPEEPRTSYNVGVISGGTSINTIAGRAEMLIDMRSVDATALAALEAEVREIIDREKANHQVEVAIEVVGDRPGGSIPADHPLVQMVRGVMEAVGLEVESRASSTDANIPLSIGIPAVCIGITDGVGAHRMDEYLYIAPMAKGMAQLFGVVYGLADLS
jgi:acetylornithine deacetylase/succinyl-diaminopimelate desuccinylase-like protein